MAITTIITMMRNSPAIVFQKHFFHYRHSAGGMISLLVANVKDVVISRGCARWKFRLRFGGIFTNV